MEHADPELLSLVALGEPVPPQLREHLSDCLACRGEVASLREVVDAVRVPLPDLSHVIPVPPPPEVWAAIAARTATVVALPGPDRNSPVRASRRTSRLVLVAAACLVAGVVLGAAGTTQFGRDPADPVATAQVLRTVDLAELPGTEGASGQARIVRAGDGRRLSVDVTGLRRPDGFYEVWLIDRKLSRMYPVGVLDGDRATFTLPPGVDVEQFPIVDVSVEPLDGNPAHSGDSVLRGAI